MNAERVAPAASEECELCSGTGWRPVSDEPGAPVTRCRCYADQDARRRLVQARIPARYEGADFEHFYLYPRIHGSLKEARHIAEKFVDAYPELDNNGLLFEGPAGVGKTHLAVAVLRELVTRNRVTGLFADYRDLLRSIQDSYNAVSETSELEILRPVLNADVLLLDELGTRRPTAWVRDTVTHILNDRYQRQRLTLITTNYPDDGAEEGDTLEDRIGRYARSRLYEMCRNVSMRGDDYREVMRSASDRPIGASAKRARVS